MSDVSVPSGTVAVVLDWVNAQPGLVVERAQAALAAEQAATKPRSGLIAQLVELAGDVSAAVTPSALNVPPSAPPDPAPLTEGDVPVEVIEAEALADGEEFYAVESFTAQVAWTTCSFAAGARIDSLAGLALEAGGAPVGRRQIES